MGTLRNGLSIYCCLIWYQLPYKIHKMLFVHSQGFVLVCVCILVG